MPTPNLTREEISLAILGRMPEVRMADFFRVVRAEPFVAVALEAQDPTEAKQMALELKQAIEWRLFSWKGWAIRYIPKGKAIPMNRQAVAA